jgi:CRISPR-associated protein Csx16
MSGFFFNISNHPSDHWSEEQLAAARAIAPELLDILFPAVPPEVDTVEVEALADRLIASLHSADLGVPWEFAKAAMVQGEHCLTTAIVQRLQQCGIACYAATTQRVVETDAEGRKISVFRFVRFRAYPNLVNGG